MSIMGVVRPVAVLALLLGLTACAERAGGAAPPTAATPSPTAALPKDPGALVLQVGYTGGFVTPDMLAGRLPMVSVYADGRVITDGPVAAIYPGPALPNLQVQQIDPAEVQVLADHALAAGVADTADLGMPPVADAPSTRFTLVTGSGTYVREVYALAETSGMPGSGLTAEQEGARARLQQLLDGLTDLGVQQAGDRAPEQYAAETIAAVAMPWTDPADGLGHLEVTWPGPALPGEAMGGPVDVSCVTATGDQARAVLDAAGKATSMTPWVSADGARWSLLFRPLLPHESGCADLRGD
jgi:hypothetical protein